MNLNEAQFKLLLLAALANTPVTYEHAEQIADKIIQQMQEPGSLLEMLIEQASNT